MKHSQPDEFTGFLPESFEFLRQLARNNHKPWFDENRAVYDEHVVGVLKSLFEQLAPVALKLHSGFEVSGRTHRNLTRINRDIRFSRDKSPYRQNMYLFFGEEDKPGREARLYVGLSAEGVTCGLGLYHRPKGSISRILKPRRADDPQLVAEYLRKMSRRYETYWHATESGKWKRYAGPPKDDKDWKRLKALVVRKLYPPEHRSLRSSRFAAAAAKIFQDLFPLYAFSTLEDSSYEKLLK
jgi:uncharacterized protein (TIGR02453 family)